MPSPEIRTASCIPVPDGPLEIHNAPHGTGRGRALLRRLALVARLTPTKVQPWKQGHPSRWRTSLVSWCAHSASSSVTEQHLDHHGSDARNEPQARGRAEWLSVAPNQESYFRRLFCL